MCFNGYDLTEAMSQIESSPWDLSAREPVVRDALGVGCADAINGGENSWPSLEHAVGGTETNRGCPAEIPQRHDEPSNSLLLGKARLAAR